MDIDIPDIPSDPALRGILLRLARLEEARAADEAATVPYWSSCPPTVHAHRLAAAVLRKAADACLARGLVEGDAA